MAERAQKRPQGGDLRHPGLRTGVALGVGAEFEPDKISLDAVVVIKKASGIRRIGAGCYPGGAPSSD
jgi:hypothetical protein